MKKLLTLFTLLLTVCSGAWATNVDIFTATATTAWSVPAGTSDADVSAKATIVGGKMTVYNGQESAIDLIKSNGSKMSFSQTNGNTMFKVTLPTALAVGDIITVDVYSNKAERGVWLTTSETYPSDGGKKIKTTNNNAKAWNNGLTYTLTADDEDLVGQTSFYIHRATNNTTYFANFKITRNISAPYIWTQPQSANYSVDDAATALTVAAIASTGDLTYQWYKNTDGDTSAKVEDQIAEATSATLASGKISTSVTGTFYYYCVVGDGGANSSTSSKATITVSAAEAPTKPEITADPGLTVAKSTEVTLTAASASGSPAPTYTWYQCDNAEKANTVEKASTASYSPSTAVAGTFYFYAVASNSEGSVASDVVTIVVNKSTECKALQVVYSNGFDAFITHPVAETYYVAEDEEVIAGTKNVGDIKTTATNGRVVAYYVAGSSVPTISSTTLSDDATYNVVGTTLTVTAEDGTTTGVYDISLTAVEPYLGGDITFDGTESWVKAPYGFIDTKGYKYQRLKRDNENTDPWDRLTPGNTRIYMFLGANTSVTLKTTNSNGNVDVKVNTVTVKNNQTWGDGKAIEVTNDLNAPYLLGIYSHQTSGDNYVSSIEITKPTTVNGTITEAGWNTFSSNYALDLSTITGGAAYVATTNDNTEVTLTETSAKVAAGTGLMIKGNVGDTFTIGVTSDAATLTRDNLLVGLPNGGTVAANDYNYVFAWKGSVATAGFWYVNDAEPTLGAGKAYLHSVGSNGAKLNIVIGETPSQEETDGIRSVENGELRNDNYFNLSGQKVGADYKGIVIVNGKKVIRK